MDAEPAQQQQLSAQRLSDVDKAFKILLLDAGSDIIKLWPAVVATLAVLVLTLAGFVDRGMGLLTDRSAGARRRRYCILVTSVSATSLSVLFPCNKAAVSALLMFALISVATMIVAMREVVLLFVREWNGEDGKPESEEDEQSVRTWDEEAMTHEFKGARHRIVLDLTASPAPEADGPPPEPPGPPWYGAAPHHPRRRPRAPSPLPPGPLPPLLALPDELFLNIVTQHLTAYAPSADLVRLRQACRILRSRLESLRFQAQATQLRFVSDGPREDGTVGHMISNKGRELTSLAQVHPDSDDDIPTIAWAHATQLQTHGLSFWRVRIDKRIHEVKGWDEQGGVMVGVCDVESRHAWGLDLGQGKLLRVTREAITASRGYYNVVVGRGVTRRGWPDGHGTQVLKDERGQPTNLTGKMNGAIIEVRLDHDHGSLAFRINGGPPREALLKGAGFPPRARLRPWVSLYLSSGDVATLLPVWRPRCY